MDLFDIAVAKKLAGGGGGGGDSDFSTAKVTLANMDAAMLLIGIEVPNDTKGLTPVALTIDPFFTVFPATVDAVLFKGKATANLSSQTHTVTASGNASVNARTVTITGDCTLSVQNNTQ